MRERINFITLAKKIEESNDAILRYAYINLFCMAKKNIEFDEKQKIIYYNYRATTQSHHFSELNIIVNNLIYEACQLLLSFSTKISEDLIIELIKPIYSFVSKAKDDIKFFAYFYARKITIFLDRVIELRHESMKKALKKPGTKIIDSIQFEENFKLLTDPKLVEELRAIAPLKDLAEGEAEFVYLVSKSWFDNFSHFIQSDPSFEDYNTELKLRIMNNWADNNRNETIYCGPVNNTALIKEVLYWRDPDDTYTNQFLVNKLKQDDFVVLAEPDFQKLKHTFGCEDILEIKRKKNNLMLLETNAIIFSNVFSTPENITQKSLQFEEKETYEDFIKKILRCMKVYSEEEINESKVSVYYYSNESDNFFNFELVLDYLIMRNFIQEEEEEKKVEEPKKYVCNIKETEIKVTKCDSNEKFEELKKLVKERKCSLIIECNSASYTEEGFMDSFMGNNQNENCHLCKKPLKNTAKCKGMDSCQFNYCSAKCRKNDKVHISFHQKIKEYFSPSFKLESLKKIDIESLFLPNSKRGKTGLNNIGNTCFMNSGLQCLSNCLPLTIYFLSKSFEKEINYSKKYGTGGEIARAYYDLLQKLWIGNETAIHPMNFRSIFIHFARRFEGFEQHDSHEMLTFMLDGLHEDLNRNAEKPYVELAEQDEKKETDSQASERLWKCLLKRDNSIIVDLFYGQYKSLVQCPVCQKISITYDPFLCLSLPLGKLSTKKVLVINEATNELREHQLKFSSKYNLSTILENNFPNPTNDKEYHVILCKENMEFYKVLNDKDSLTFLDDARAHLIIYEYEKNFMKDKKPLYVIPGTRDTNEPPKLLFYPKPFWYSPEDKLEHLFQDIKEYYKNIYKINVVFICAANTLDEDEDEAYKINIYSYIEGNFIPVSDPPETTIGSFYDKYSHNQEILLYLEIDYVHYCNSKMKLYSNFSEQSMFHSDSNDNAITLDSCLKQLSEREQLDSDNQWYCSQCKERREAFKELQIYRLPKILIIQLKRFKAGPGHPSLKNNSFVDFPVDELVLDDYVAESKKEDLGTGAKKYVYELFAISLHFGGTSGGHYTAFCKGIDGEWYEYDDETVSPIPKSKVVDKNAYLLFYKQKE